MVDAWSCVSPSFWLAILDSISSPLGGCCRCIAAPPCVDHTVLSLSAFLPYTHPCQPPCQQLIASRWRRGKAAAAAVIVTVASPGAGGEAHGAVRSPQQYDQGCRETGKRGRDAGMTPSLTVWMAWATRLARCLVRFICRILCSLAWCCSGQLHASVRQGLPSN